MAELGIVAAQGREGVKELVKIIPLSPRQAIFPRAVRVRGLRSRSRVTHGYFSGWWRARFNTA